MADCYKCLYRSRITLSCDYILVTGQSRGEPAGCSCTKYKPRSDGGLVPYVLDLEKLYWMGYSDRRIARELKVSRYFVYTWRQANGLEPKGEKLRGRPKKE